MNFAQVKVETYSGYKANERPLAFEMNGRRYEVAEVLDRWYEGGTHGRIQQLDYFKVRTVEGIEFIIRYNPLFEAWSVLTP